MLHKIKEETLENIGSSIRNKLNTNVKYDPVDMPAAIDSIEQYRMVQTSDVDLDNGFYGRRAAAVAESYLYARQIAGQEFNYKTYNFLTNHQADGDYGGGDDSFENDAPDNDDVGSYTVSNDFDGYDPNTTYGYRLFDYASQPNTKFDGTFANNIAPCLDCSTFVLLALLGIPWENSPWIRYGDPKNGVYTWDPRNLENLVELSSDGTGWQQKELMYQPEGIFRDLGMQRQETVVGPNGAEQIRTRKFSCVRTAADLAQFYVNQGTVLYDRPIYTPEQREQNVPTEEEIWSIVQPGDLVFWSNLSTGKYGEVTMRQPNRFRCVSHVAMISNNPMRTVEVTSGNKMPNAVYYRLLNNELNPDSSKKRTRLNGITLIIRPDYRPRRGKEQVPLNKNLLEYPWTFSQLRRSTISGVQRWTMDGGNIHLEGTASAQITTYLKGSTTNGAYNYLELPAGTYTLSGMDGTGIQRTTLSLRVRNIDGTQFDTPVICYDGHHARFTLNETTRVQVVLHIASGLSVNSTITPTLIRNS